MAWQDGFTPKNHGLLVRDIDSDTRNLAAVLHLIKIKGLAFEVEIPVRIKSLQGSKAVELEAEIIDVKKVNENTDVLTLSINFPNLEPGEYEMVKKALAVK